MTDLDKLEALAKAVVNAREAYSASDDGSVAESEAFLALDKAGEALDEVGDPAVIILDLIASARRDAEEIERLRNALQWYASPEIYKPHPHGPAFDRRDLSYHAAAALRPQPFGRAAHTGEG